MWSPAISGIIYYTILVGAVLFVIYYLIRNIQSNNSPNNYQNVYITTNRKPLLFLDDEKKLAINMALIKTIYVKNTEIYTELFNGDTFIIKKCLDEENPQTELENIIKSINM